MVEIVLNFSPLLLLYPCRKDEFCSYSTSKYKLNFYETPSGLKFVLNTDLGVGNIRETMLHLYSKVSSEFGWHQRNCLVAHRLRLQHYNCTPLSFYFFKFFYLYVNRLIEQVIGIVASALIIPVIISPVLNFIEMVRLSG